MISAANKVLRPAKLYQTLQEPVNQHYSCHDNCYKPGPGLKSLLIYLFHVKNLLKNHGVIFHPSLQDQPVTSEIEVYKNAEDRWQAYELH